GVLLRAAVRLDLAGRLRALFFLFGTGLVVFPVAVLLFSVFLVAVLAGAALPGGVLLAVGRLVVALLVLEAAAVREDVADLRLFAEEVAVRDHEVGGLAGRHRTELPLDAEDAGGVEGERLQSRIGRQAGGDGLAEIGAELIGRPVVVRSRRQ